LNATPDPEISTISMTWAGALSTLNSDTDDSLNIKYHAGRSVGPMNACAERKTSQLPHLWRRVSGWIRTRLRSLSIPGTLC
jgi:hypothetical protein